MMQVEIRVIGSFIRYNRYSITLAKPSQLAPTTTTTATHLEMLSRVA
jgi:hypothetical protein